MNMKDSITDVYKINYANQTDIDRLSDSITNLSLIVREYCTKQDLFIAELRSNANKLENQLDKIESRLMTLEDDKKGRDARINLFYRIFKSGHTVIVGVMFVFFVGGITIFNYMRKDADYFVRQTIQSQERIIPNGIVSTSN